MGGFDECSASDGVRPARGLALDPAGSLELTPGLLGPALAVAEQVCGGVVPCGSQASGGEGAVSWMWAKEPASRSSRRRYRPSLSTTIRRGDAASKDSARHVE